MHRFVSAILTCAILAALPVLAVAVQASPAKPVAEDRDPLSYRKLEWIAMVRGREFARLTRLLEAVQKKYETGQITSFDVEKIYDKFNFTDLELQKNFNEWVAADPVAAPPLIARGNFLAHLGFTLRRNVIGRTPAPAAQTIDKLMGQAIRDYYAAIAIHRSSVTTYSQLMRIYTTFNPHEFVQRVYEDALRSVSEARLIQFRYALSLHPNFRHGRNAEEKKRIFQEYEDFIQKAKDLSATEPDYKTAVRFAKGKIADRAYEDDRFSVAEGLYSEILKEQDTPYYRFKRASLRTYLKRFDEAEIDVRKSIELDADYIPSYVAGWGFERRRKNYRKAGQYIQSALDLDPFDPELLQKRAIIYSRNGQNGLAIRTLEKALVLGNWNGKVHHHLGTVYNNIRNWKKASEHFKAAFLLKPWDIILMGNLMNSLMRVEDCMFFDLAPSYAERCSKSKRCQRDGYFEVLKFNLKSLGLEKICRRTAPWNEKPKPNSF